jgi:LPXTG-motif cell wall-anchored protein
MERSNNMKRLILCILAIFLLTAGAAMAQTANTTAPGPTVQREPGLVSNNLPNPGNPQTDLSAQQDAYSQEQQPLAQEPAVTEPTTTEPMDTETEATGTTDVETSTTTDTGIDETGTTETDTGELPDTASELPLLVLAGLLALASAFMVRLRRNA